jgi:hypothetical protein
MDMKIAFAVCCCLLVLIASACMDPDREMVLNKERGSKIIHAIDCYVQEYGQLPTQLEALVPKCLDEIPKAVSDQDFGYVVWSTEYTEYYELGFNLASAPNRGCGYISRFERWECVAVDVKH